MSGQISMKVFVDPNVYEHLITAAATDGLSRTDVINRAVTLYALMQQAPVNKVVDYVDREGTHRVWARLK